MRKSNGTHMVTRDIGIWLQLRETVGSAATLTSGEGSLSTRRTNCSSLLKGVLWQRGSIVTTSTFKPAWKSGLRGLLVYYMKFSNF